MSSTLPLLLILQCLFLMQRRLNFQQSKKKQNIKTQTKMKVFCSNEPRAAKAERPINPGRVAPRLLVAHLLPPSKFQSVSFIAAALQRPAARRETGPAWYGRSCLPPWRRRFLLSSFRGKRFHFGHESANSTALCLDVDAKSGSLICTEWSRSSAVGSATCSQSRFSLRALPSARFHTFSVRTC